MRPKTALGGVVQPVPRAFSFVAGRAPDVDHAGYVNGFRQFPFALGGCPQLLASGVARRREVADRSSLARIGISEILEDSGRPEMTDGFAGDRFLVKLFALDFNQGSHARSSLFLLHQQDRVLKILAEQVN